MASEIVALNMPSWRFPVRELSLVGHVGEHRGRR